MDPISRELEGVFPNSRVSTFHRGSAGLYHLLRAIRTKRGAGEVVIPNLCCETVPLAARFAGHEIRFSDVDDLRLCITAQTLEDVISPRTVAVVIVHLFGMTIDATDFEHMRKKYDNVIFIEDIAHAAGSHDKSNQEVGFGFDHTMLSFSNSKVLGGNGGAIVSHCVDDVSNELHAGVSHALAAEADSLLALSLRNLVHAIADLHRAGSEGAGREISERIWDRFHPLITGGGCFGDPARAASDLSNRLEIAKRRRRLANTYRNTIINPRLRCPPIMMRETIWRLPIIAETSDLRRNATDALRSAGIHASNHYFPLNRLFNAPSLPVSEAIGDKLFNLWVDDTITPVQIATTSKILNEL